MKLKKDKIFRNKFADLKITVLESGWVMLEQKFGKDKDVITLGNYPNARFELIEKMLRYVKNEPKI
jgi:hypothetical protein